MPTFSNEVWSLDFMHGQRIDRRALRLLNVLDDCNREALGIKAVFHSRQNV